LGLLADERVKVTSSGALPTEEVVRNGVRARPDINAIASRREREIEVLVWNYHDDDFPVPAAPIDLLITGLPAHTKRALVEHYRIDSDHGNAFSAWKEMGSPQSPSPDQHDRLESAGQLQLLASPRWIELQLGVARVQFMLPRQGLSLIRLAW
jgi:xylan 1,4-beta-xylosidase